MVKFFFLMKNIVEAKMDNIWWIKIDNKKKMEFGLATISALKIKI